MTKETRRFGNMQHISSAETSDMFRVRVNDMITQFVELEEIGWDLDWSHVTIDTELSSIETVSLTGYSMDDYITEVNQVRMSILGRR